MTCCAGYPFTDGGERVFDVETARIAYGSGAMAELGARARSLDMTRIALFADPALTDLAPFRAALRSLRASGYDPIHYDRIHIEPTDTSFADAIAFAREARTDGYISIGGGSTIDTAKAANLYATHPADLLAYVNAPVGAGGSVPGPLAPHIACPTTAGTGSECTGIAIFDHLPLAVKTGIASRRLRPSLALIDPDWTASLPPAVVACAGFDVLSHALESYTARPYTQRSATAPAQRPLSQGANPFSDLASLEALRIIGRNLERAVNVPNDGAARERMMYAATLAGIGFGNAGVHVPHAMAYAIAGSVRAFVPAGYPPHEALVPHGMAVILGAPAAFMRLANGDPERHRIALEALEGTAAQAAGDDVGERLAAHLRGLMTRTGMPPDLRAVGYTRADLGTLVAGTLAQQRLLANAPHTIDAPLLTELFTSALQATEVSLA